MRLIERFSAGLFNPGQVVYFHNDKKRITFLFFLLLVLLYAIPNIIYSITMYDLDYSEKVEIRETFERGEELPFLIRNGELLKYSTDSKDHYIIDYPVLSMTKIVFTVNDKIELADDRDLNLVAFMRDGVYLYSPITKYKLLSYSEFDLEGINLSLAKKDNTQFWDHMFRIIDEVLDIYKTPVLISYNILLILSNCLQIVLFSAFMTFISRFGITNSIKFGKHWQMNIYLMSPFVIGSLLSTLFGISIIYYIGLFITFIYSIGINQDSKIGG